MTSASPGREGTRRSRVRLALRRRRTASPGYGVGVDERAVEYPWLYAHRPYGRLLDAGSVLNRPDVLDRFLAQADELHIVTLAPERRFLSRPGRLYVYADIRDLPYRDGTFDTVICASTLQRVGMDNSRYAPDAEREDEPEHEAERAARELCRVLTPGGRLLVTVPYGVREDLRWLLQFDSEALDRLVDETGTDEVAATFFRYTREGWQRSSRAEADDARYRDPDTDPLPDDLAACARAVACVALTIP